VPSSRRLSKLVIAAAASACCLSATPALALDDCDSLPKVRVLADEGGALESVGVDAKGHVYFTNADEGELLRLRTDGRPPRVVSSGIDGPGGIIFARGKVIVGYGNSLAQGSDGILSPEAGLYEVNPRTGQRRTLASGLQTANGVARGPGAIYASTGFGTGIDRIQGGEVQLQWSKVPSPNGMVADAAGKSLFANQTLVSPPRIMRVPFGDPGAAQPYFTSTAPEDAAAGLDGLARGNGNTLYAAANGSGAVWRVDGPSAACTLLHWQPFPKGPSDVAFGRGRGIPRSSLLVTTFSGQLLELRKAR
jgi:sugar lactone lactonase YvrE